MARPCPGTHRRLDHRLLCSLLGDSGRRIVIAGLLAILTLWLAKAFLQKFIEFPDLTREFYKDPEANLRSQGISPDDTVQVKLFESRLDSAEVTSYLSLSNVFATGLIGLLSLLTALVTAQILSWLHPSRGHPGRIPAAHKTPKNRQPKSAPIRSASSWRLSSGSPGTVPSLPPLTRSKGGTGLGFAAVIAIALGGFCWKWFLAHRRALIAAALLILAFGASAALFYGIRHDAPLPSKSLTFRWHYWTASVPHPSSNTPPGASA